MVDDAVELGFRNGTKRGHFARRFGIIKVEEDFAEIENDNFRFAHSGDLPAAFEGAAEREFVGEFKAAANGEPMGDAGDGDALIAKKVVEVKTGGIAFDIGWKSNDHFVNVA